MWSLQTFHICLIILLSRVDLHEFSSGTGMDQSSELSYGGILNNLVSMSADDADIKIIAKFAADYAKSRHPNSIPQNEQGYITPWETMEPKKLKLHFTEDGIHPFIFEEVSHGPNGPQIQKRQAILGITYFFMLTWPSTSIGYVHRFIINKDREKQLHVYSHTFYKDTLAAENKRSYTDQSASCYTDDMGLVSRTLDQSEGSSALDSQSDCKERSSHNLWTDPSEEDADRGCPTCSSEEVLGKFTSYNIWNFNGRLREEDDKKFYCPRKERMGKLLAESKSDIIGVQEVRFDYQYTPLCGPSQVAHLAGHLKDYQFIYQPANTFWRGHLGRSEEGLALFSRHPILSHDYILLTRNRSDEEDRHQRICLHAEIHHPALGVVHVFVSHLSLSIPAREKSVVEIWNYMQRFTGPAILMGDLNAEPHEQSMRFLRGEIELLGHQTEGLIDAWRVLHNEPRPDVPGTYKRDEPRDFGLTFSTLEEHMRKRIDYIYLRLTDDVKLQEASLVDDGLRGNKAASDHVGVAAILKKACDGRL